MFCFLQIPPPARDKTDRRNSPAPPVLHLPGGGAPPGRLAACPSRVTFPLGPSYPPGASGSEGSPAPLHSIQQRRKWRLIGCARIMGPSVAGVVEGGVGEWGRSTGGEVTLGGGDFVLVAGAEGIWAAEELQAVGKTQIPDRAVVGGAGVVSRRWLVR